MPMELTRREAVAGLSDNFVVAADAENGHIYFDRGSPSEIVRADADGSNPTVIINGNGGNVFGLAVDPAAGYLFWSDFNTAIRVMRSDLDGSNVMQIASATSPSGMAVDPVNRKVYFITYNSTTLYRVNYDGTGQESIVSGLTGQGVGVAVDSVAGKVYYSDRADSIFVADLDGSNAAVLISGQTAVQGIDIDVNAGLIYWTTPLAGMIRSARLADGSNVQDVTASNGNGWGLAVMAAP